MEEHIGKLVIENFKIRRLIYYMSKNGWTEYTLLDIKFGKLEAGMDTKPNIIPLYGVISMEDYKELEDYWDFYYEEYIVDED